MVSGYDNVDLNGPANGLWNNSVVNSTAKGYHASQPPLDQSITAPHPSSPRTVSPLRSAPHGSIQDAGTATRISPTQTPSIAINTPGTQTLGSEDNSNNSSSKCILYIR